MSMQLVFWVTNDCNLNCTYCYEGQFKEKKYMSLDVAMHAVNLFLEYYNQINDSELIIRFHGGEPLLNCKAILYIQNMVSKNLKGELSYGITTNGCTQTEDAFNVLKSMDEINISIDGCKEINDLYRKDRNGKGTYDRVIKTVNWLKQNVDPSVVNIRMTYNSITVNTLAESILHFADIGCKSILPAPDLFDSGWNSDKINILEEQLNKVKNTIAAKNLEINISGLDRNDFKLRGLCSGGTKSFHINSCGNIYPCTYVVNEKDFCIGNIYAGIDYDKIAKLEKMYTTPNSCCEGCTYYRYCIATRCKLVNWKLTRSLFTPCGAFCAIEKCKLRVNNII